MAFVIEILNRANQALSLRQFDVSQVSVGRGFDQSLIVEDPFVDACHVQLRSDQNTHTIECIDLDSKNGVAIEPVVGKKYAVQGSTKLSSGDVVIIGRTRMRVCHPQHYVPEAEPLTFWHRCIHDLSSWPIAVFMATLVAAITVVQAYLNLPVETALRRHGIESIYVVVGMFVYGAFWAAIGRTLRGDGHFITQSLIAGGAVIVMSLLSFVTPWLAYHLPNENAWALMSDLFTAVVFCVAVFASARMATRLPKAGVLAVALILPGAMALNKIIELVDRPSVMARVPYERVLVNPALNIRPSISADAFYQQAKNLYGSEHRERQPSVEASSSSAGSQAK
ncbi:MAG TPA: FHA domain-containing protein [Marinagarivorans sp.]